MGRKAVLTRNSIFVVALFDRLGALHFATKQNLGKKGGSREGMKKYRSIPFRARTGLYLFMNRITCVAMLQVVSLDHIVPMNFLVLG